MYRDNVGAHLS